MRRSRIALISLWMWGLIACSSHPRKVDCEAHLLPINPPTHVAKVAAEARP